MKMSNSGISVTRDERIDSSPSSKGNQIKWRTKTGLWLKADDLGYEGLSETIASKMLKDSNIGSYVTYAPCCIMEEGVKYRGCVSEDFLKPGESLITLQRLYETHGRDAYAEFDGKSASSRLSGLIESVTIITKLQDFGLWLGKLLEFDAFILNEDRHLQNIALVINTDEKFSLMPVFDNGAAFLSDTMRDYPLTAPTSKLISKVRSKPIVTSFDKQNEAVKEVVGLSLKLGRYADFEAGDFEYYNEEEVRRVKNVIKAQSMRYPNLFE